MKNRLPIHKHIYKVGSTYHIDKSINNKRIHFKSCKTLDEAIEYRDRLVANNWKQLPLTSEEKQEKNAKEYYKRIQRNGRKTGYNIRNDNDRYLSNVGTIEEALYYRDLYRECSFGEAPKAGDVDLITDNPYIKDGLKYPLPERLKLNPPKTDGYGFGSIVKKGENSYHLYHGKKSKNDTYYICACPTIEMAEYVRAEMNKCNWDVTQLDRILNDYPKYYTKLLFFYQYIHKGRYSEDKWDILIPKEYLPEDTTLELVTGYKNIEDALFERDFLMEHNWDYDLLVECIDDCKNPYYDMTLPPYPTRKIRNISKRNYREKELTQMYELIQDNKDITLEEIRKIMNVTDVTIRNWLKKGYGVSFMEFKKLCIAGENPVNVLEKIPQIIQPDLSKPKPPNFNNYVSYLQKHKRWQVRKGKETYGVYPNEELAHKISKDLQKCNWDKSRLKNIQAKHGHTSPIMSKKWCYKQGNKWAVRRKNKDKTMITYGVWNDKRIAQTARDLYILHGFNLDNQEWINEMAEWIIYNVDSYPSTMFGQVTIEDITYIETSNNIPGIRKTKEGTWEISKSQNNNTVYYGRYKTEEKAIEVFEFLEDNNWDKDLLKVMKEMGEI